MGTKIQECMKSRKSMFIERQLSSRGLVNVVNMSNMPILIFFAVMQKVLICMSRQRYVTIRSRR